MKFIIFLFLSIGCHLGWFYYQPISPDKLQFSHAQLAHQLAIKIVTSEPAKAQQKQVVEAVAVAHPVASTQFHSKVKRLAKQSVEQESYKIAKANTVKPNIEKPLPKVTQVNKKTKPTAEIMKTQSPASTAAPASSAPVIAKQQSLKNQVVEINTLPLFKAPRPVLHYPFKAKRRGYQGVAVLQIELAKDGSISQLTVLKSSGFSELDKAALNNVSQWQFHPVVRDNHNIKARFSVPIEFSLRS